MSSRSASVGTNETSICVRWSRAAARGRRQRARRAACCPRAPSGCAWRCRRAQPKRPRRRAALRAVRPSPPARSGGSRRRSCARRRRGGARPHASRARAAARAARAAAACACRRRALSASIPKPPS
eukprot:1189966-Pleurochrysis_carterae.AAC.1